MIIGIDPGFKGGAACVSRLGNLIDGIRMPITSLRKREMIDTAELSRFVKACDHPIDAVVIEAVHSMPKQGVASTFKFGRAAGAVEAWAIAMFGSDLLHFSTPRKWKRDMHLTSDKRAALERAAELWPCPPDHIKWNILRNDGIAEAALIAEHYRTY